MDTLNTKEEYLRLKNQFQDNFNEQNYDKSFNYVEKKASYKELNFVFLLDKKSLTYFENQLGIFDHEMHEDLGSASEVTTINNSYLLDKFQINSLCYKTKYPLFKSLKYFIRDFEEEDMVFFNKQIFDLVKAKNPKYKAIKKVVHQTNDGLKIEIWNPIVNVLFNNNDKKITTKTYKEFLCKIPISKYMNGKDLSILCQEIAISKFKEKKYDLDKIRILLPEENEIEPNIAILYKGNLVCEEINHENLSQFDIYNERFIIFAYKDNVSEWKISSKTKKDKNQFSKNCSFCKKEIAKVSKSKFCVCGNLYCSQICQKNDKNHQCTSQKCKYCDKYLSKSDMYSLTICNCGVLYCEDDCLDKDKTFHEGSCPFLKLQTEVRDNRHRNDGKVGLSNIGNTCYMNSALQCLLHTDTLKDLFLDLNYIKDINYNNPLGTKGELLKEIGKLFLEYWSTSKYKITPSNFKRKMSNYLSSFDGYAQHDSQEFLSQILDSIHEDLNRIIHKPYTTSIEGKLNDNDETIARQSWINFIKRNYSPIIDKFYGQFKSTVICPDCKNSSVTFDPFQLISLSIPTISKQEFDFYYIGSDHIGKAEKFTFTGKSLHKFRDISLGEIIESFCGKLKIDENKQVFAALGFSAVGEVCGKNETLERIYEMRILMRSKPKIFLCGLNEHEIEVKKKKSAFPIYLKTNYEIFDVSDEEKKSYDFQKKTRKINEDPIFTKFVFSDNKMTVRDLYVMVFRKFFHVTSLIKNNKAKTMNYEDFEILWSKIETKTSLQFFYLKLNDEILKLKSTEKLIDLKGKSYKLVIKVFIKSKKNTEVEVDLEYFVNCSSNHEISPKFSSKDISSYKGEYSLNYILENFLKPEILDTENAWYCSICKNHVQATRTIHIYKVPQYLIINLKKLKMNSAKKVPLITFPIEELNMEDFVLSKKNVQAYNLKPEEFYPPKDLEYYTKKDIPLLLSETSEDHSLKYKLYGVINHFGSQHFGHYTATVNYNNDNWGDFNDSNVTNEEKKNIVGDGAYVLFYKRFD